MDDTEELDWDERVEDGLGIRLFCAIAKGPSAPAIEARTGSTGEGGGSRGEVGAEPGLNVPSRGEGGGIGNSKALASRIEEESTLLPVTSALTSPTVLVLGV